MATEIGIIFIAGTTELASTYEQGILKTMPQGTEARDLHKKEPIYTKIIVVPEVTPQIRNYLKWLMPLSHIRRITCICSVCLSMFGPGHEHVCLPEKYCPDCESKFQPMRHDEKLCPLCKAIGSMPMTALFA